MHPPFQRRLRSIAVFILIFFSWLPSVTKEFQLYQLAQFALDALKKIDPNLANEYT